MATKDTKPAIVLTLEVFPADARGNRKLIVTGAPQGEMPELRSGLFAARHRLLDEVWVALAKRKPQVVKVKEKSDGKVKSKPPKAKDDPSEEEPETEAENESEAPASEEAVAAFEAQVESAPAEEPVAAPEPVATEEQGDQLVEDLQAKVLDPLVDADILQRRTEAAPAPDQLPLIQNDIA